MFFYSDSVRTVRIPAIVCACVSTLLVLTFTNLSIA